MVTTKEIRKEWKLPAIAYPKLLSLESKNYGYFVSDNYVLPYYVKNKLGCKNMRFILSPQQLTHNNTTGNDELYFLNEVVNHIEENRLADFISCPDPSALFSLPPKGALYCKFGSYVIDLDIPEDALFANIHTKHKNVIRKAQKDGIIISYEHKYKEKCITLVTETLLRQNMGIHSDEYFICLSQSDYVDFFVALENNEVIGAAILTWSTGRSCYYLFGGSSPNIHGGAMNLLHWEAMKIMKNRGVKNYDFVGARLKPISGSKLEGIQRFKSRFGGELKEGYLWKIPINKLKTSFYYSALKIYGKLKKINVKDIIDQENEQS